MTKTVSSPKATLPSFASSPPSNKTRTTGALSRSGRTEARKAGARSKMAAAAVAEASAKDFRSRTPIGFTTYPLTQATGVSERCLTAP